MIPYQELAVALERWRVRSGLPTHAEMPAPAPRPIVVPTAPAAVVARPSGPPAPPPGRSTVYGVPPPPAAVIAAAQATAPRPPTTLPPEELDAEVLDEDHVYDNEGSDFAVEFGGPPPATSGSIGEDDGDDRTAMAALTNPVAALDDPFGAETAAVRADVWPEVAEAQNWQAEQTNATAYGWGAGLRPESQARSSTDADGDDGDGSTVVGSNKPR